MGAVEHLKSLCCLGLPPESAMIAVAPVLHEIIPHGWYRVSLLDPDTSITSRYAENPACETIFRERIGKFLNDPTSLVSIYVPSFHAVGIGWSLHLQGRGYLESGYFREIEGQLDSCWILDAMIGDSGRTIAGIQLTRPRGARPFSVDDVLCLDRLRPWLAHALRRKSLFRATAREQEFFAAAGPPVSNGQIILTPQARCVFQTPGMDALRAIMDGDRWSVYTMGSQQPREMPSPVQALVRNLTGAANGRSNAPPRLRVSTAYGVLTLEAKWLVPAGTLPEGAARDPKACLISVTAELREHPIAHAARILRASGATPAQMKIGIQLALGKTKPVIADELGIELSTVMSLTKKLYQTLDVHNPAELGTKIWLGQKQDEPSQNWRRAG